MTVVDALGYEASNSYNSKNNLTSTTDKDGKTSVSDYDTSGIYLQYTQDPLGNRTTYSVATNGLVSWVKDPNGNQTTYTYDGTTGDKLTVKDPLGHNTTFTYDSVGRQVTATDPLGNEATKTYDAAGNLLTAKAPAPQTGGSEPTTTTTYDVYGRVLSTEDPNGHTTAYSYDPRGLLLQVVDPVNGASHPTSYQYDAAGNRTTVTDANGDSWSYSYDEDHRPLTVTDPNSVVTLSDGYDAAGRLTTSTDGKHQTTTYSYDQRGGLTGIAYAGGAGSVSFTLDGNGNRLAMADSTGTTTYSYDAGSRLTGVTYPGSRTVGYGYDAAGNRTSLTYPGGSHAVTYGYDADERLTSAEDWLGNTTSYGYDAASRLSTVMLPTSGSSVIGSYAYFNNNALQSISWAQGSTTLASATYTVDQNGNRTSRTTAFASGGSAQAESYCYDALNRLTAVYSGTSCGAGTETQSYGFDAAGNRTSLATSAGTTAYTYDAADQLTKVTPPSPASAITYTYDANGSVTARGSDSFTWDGANRLSAATVAGADPETMTYNGDGLRQTRTDTTTGTSTNFVWDVASKLPVVLDDGSQYVYGVSGLVEQVQSGTPYYFLQDGLGSTLAVVDGTGTIQQTESYDIYGHATAGTNSHPTEYQFAGQETDPTSLQYLRTRYYDPATGRFLSRDPAPIRRFDSLALNPYGYGDERPSTLSDPSGRDWDSGGGGACESIACCPIDETFSGAGSTFPSSAQVIAGLNPYVRAGAKLLANYVPLQAIPGLGVLQVVAKIIANAQSPTVCAAFFGSIALVGLSGGTVLAVPIVGGEVAAGAAAADVATLVSFATSCD